MQSDGYQVPGVFFAKNDEKPYSNKTTTNPSKLKYLQKFKGKDGGGKYLKFEKKNAQSLRIWSNVFLV